MVVISVRGVKPPTQGSISAFGAGIAVDTHEKRLKPYRQKIRDAYKEQGGEYFDQYVPVCLEATFYFKKPKKNDGKIRFQNRTPFVVLECNPRCLARIVQECRFPVREHYDEKVSLLHRAWYLDLLARQNAEAHQIANRRKWTDY